MTRSELLREQREADAQLRSIIAETVVKLRRVYPPFPGYLVGGALDDLIGDLGYWLAEPDAKLEQTWADLAAEAEDPEAGEADFRNKLARENA